MLTMNKLISKIKELFFKKESSPYIKIWECDGCANKFKYPLHDYDGFESCSKECDEMIEEIENQMQL